MIHVEVHVECVALELDADGRADEGAVRRALARALEASGELADLRGRPVAEVVARRVVHYVRGVVPPC